MKKQLVVLFGGHSSEYEVSLVSAYAVLTNTDTEKYDILPVGITKDGLWLAYTGDYADIPTNKWCENPDSLPRVTVDLTPNAQSFLLRAKDGTTLSRLRADVVFPVLHGAYGEDGAVQGLLELAGIPFVGCGHASSAVCMDKTFTKRIIAALGLKQADYVVALRTDDTEAVIAEAEKVCGYPMFVKPARAGSSVGVSKAKDAEQLRRALEIAFREDEKIMIEETIVGMEIETAVLQEGDRYTVADVAEILAGAEFYDYDAKYNSTESSYCLPARLPKEIRDEVRARAEKIFRTLDCRTLARVDFFCRPSGEIVFNEINTLPGFTPISMYPKLLMALGMSYAELIDRLLCSAME